MKIKIILAAVLAASLSACSNTDKVTSVKPSGNIVVATVASDFTSGSHASIQRGTDGSYTASNNLVPTGSDITVAAFGNHFYRIERNDGENITKFSFDDPQTPIWQFSTKDNSSDAVSSNPHAMVFVNENKAYVIRYGKDKVWIVNPSATVEADFKIGELDLSAYGGADGIPDMDNAIIVNGKLFITMQRQENFVPGDAYVAVFDVLTDTEIDAGITGDALKGIPLSVRNPNANIQYLAEDNSVYISAIGSFSPNTFVGGVEKINVSTFKTHLVYNDESTFGTVADFAIKSPTQAYFIGYHGFVDNTLYALNPITGVVSETKNSALIGVQLSSLNLDKSGDLWVSNSSAASLYVINTVDDSETAVIDTQLNPNKVVFGN